MREIVTPSYIRQVALPGVIGVGGPFFSAVSDAAIYEAIEASIAEVERELSTRFEPTRFVTWTGAGMRPDAVPGSSDFPVEPEDPADWPGTTPGDGNPRFRTRVRPILSVESVSIGLPGASSSPLNVPPDWLRVSGESGEVIVMPSGAATPMVAPSLPVSVYSFIRARIPSGLWMTYVAGCTEAYLRKNPQLRRLVSLRCACAVIPMVSTHLNPEGLTSESADGLSQSRAGAYPLKDLEERLKAEADDLQTAILNRWDGLGLLSL